MDRDPEPAPELIARVQTMADHDWAYRRPPPVMPMPARDISPLNGQRLVMSVPHEHIWRYDLRSATEPHWYAGRWCVGVVPERDWYRRARDPSALVVPYPYPLEWLWVEIADENAIAQDEVDQSAVGATMGFAAHLTHDPSTPPVRVPTPALSASTVAPGARACLMTSSGTEWGLRVCGTPRLAEFPTTVDLSGDIDALDRTPTGPKVPLCWETDWYRWEDTGKPPVITHCWLVPVWLE